MRSFCILYVLVLSGAVVGCARDARRPGSLRAIAAATAELEQQGAKIDRTEYTTRVSFRDTSLDDDALARAAAQLKTFGLIEQLDLRGTGVTGRSLAALSNLHVQQLVIEPDQIDHVSVRQLNECRSIQGIKLTGGITEETLVGLAPALREWTRPGRKILILDEIPGRSLELLESEVPRLSGVQTDWGWHPLAEAWRDPK